MLQTAKQLFSFMIKLNLTKNNIFSNASGHSNLLDIKKFIDQLENRPTLDVALSK